ncbi:MAG: hypothetical protein MRY57_02985 [Candidatus Pacebacteria bacterium]|nr:hypothetical protein [Candidatus Paceibacterota bacterium]
MRKIILLCMSVIVFACSTDDDVIVQNPNPEPTGFDYTLSVLGEPVYEDGTAKVPISATANPTPLRLGLKFIQGSSDIGGGVLELTNNSGTYTRPDNNFGLHPDESNNGIVTVELWTQEPGQNGWQPASTGNPAQPVTSSFTLNWPDDMDPNDPDPEAEVRITSLERLENPTGSPSYRIGYSDNTNTNGSITIELWKGGVFQGISFDRALIQESGFIETDEIDNLIDGDIYQFRIINLDGQTPVYKFLDINDQLSESHVIEFTALDNAVSLTINGHNFSSVTSNSLTAELDFNIDTAGEVITARLFQTSDLNTVVAEENSDPTTVGNQLFISMFGMLNPNTSYTVKYFHNGNEIFTSSIQTANAGSYRTEIESVSTEVNTIDVVIEYDNTTGADINAEIVFTGVDYDGDPLIQTEPVVFINGNTNTDIMITKSGFKQNSNIVVEVMVNAMIEETQSVMTNPIQYSNVQISGGVIMNSNQGSTLVATISFTADGYGSAEDFVLSHSFPVGLDYNIYNDNLRVSSSNTIDATWNEITSGNWEYVLNHSEDIAPGFNSFDGYLGTEVYTPSGGTGTSDDGNFNISFVDDNGVTISPTGSGVLVQYQ